MSDQNVFQTISEYGVVPLVTLDDPNDAVPLAHALVDAGFPIAEVTFRTAAGGEGIKRMAKEVPEIIVGSGTVHDVDHAKETKDNGGKFVITPGFNPKVVDWCLKNDMPVCPGTVTPADLEQALDFGLKVVKFFPAEAYGGIKTLKALAGPYASLKFVPTGGVGLNNLLDYLSLPNVAAAGGSFIPPAKLVKAKDWDGIVKLGKQIQSMIFGFSVGHVGINAGEPGKASSVNDAIAAMFNTDFRETELSYFTGDIAEILKKPFVGEHGHVCVDTRDLPRAIAMLRRKGVKFDEKNFAYDAKGNLVSAYLLDEIGGFAFHVRQRPAK
ncbi:MAG: bifunctional 4-hydroxy-2-oxoglutarate aldolase/2-dehydro-3-deoxy-phosphogluconate aldolase [Succinivibrio sp.]|nr:bifunctional 4-hydroxy-2-oxoglutarate aldolase/2-dehydro-3-deoxy-phosphogluconate aldolase [Succinivibrio sp.]